MWLYLKVLLKAKDSLLLIPLYGVITIFAVIFSLINFTILIPVLQIIFNQVPTNINLEKPCFSLSVAYLKDIFIYYFNGFIEQYGQSKALIFVILILITSVFFSNLLRWLSDIIVSKICVDVVRNIRLKILKCFEFKSMSYFTNDNKNLLLTNLTSDTQEIEHGINDLFRVIMKDPIAIVGYFIVMYYMSPRFTIFSFMLLPIAGWLINALIVKLRQNAKNTQDKLTSIMSSITEVFNNLNCVRAFGTFNFVLEKFKIDNKKYSDNQFKMEYNKNLLPALSEFLGVSIVAGVLAYGGYQVISRNVNLSASAFITYIIIFSQALVPIKAFAKALSHIQRSCISVERIFNVLNIKMDNNKKKIPISNFRDTFQINNISHTYENGESIYFKNGIIHKNDKIAIVGPNGSGKSTFLNIISGLFDNYKGNIILDGYDFQEYNKKDLCKLIGYCQQQTYIFKDTVYNNIAMGRDISPNDIYNICIAVGANDFIRKMPYDYDTIIGNYDFALSGGEARKICLARVMVTNPQILILDEPTSSLDETSEQKFFEFLHEYSKNKTLIITTHNSKYLNNFDIIWYMK